MSMLFDEEPLTLTEATKALPSLNGRRLHVSTLWRWARKGVHGVQLETRRIGVRIVTSREALERFTKTLAELPERRDSTGYGPRVEKPAMSCQAARKRAQEAAARTLDRAGILD